MIGRLVVFPVRRGLHRPDVGVMNRGIKLSARGRQQRGMHMRKYTSTPYWGLGTAAEHSHEGTEAEILRVGVSILAPTAMRAKSPDTRAWIIQGRISWRADAHDIVHFVG